MKLPNMSVLAFAALASPVFGQAPTPDLNDYPTDARAEYVFTCMAVNGQNQEVLRRCSCSIDVVASILPYDRYVAAETVLAMRQTAGERAGVMRSRRWRTRWSGPAPGPGRGRDPLLLSAPLRSARERPSDREGALLEQHRRLADVAQRLGPLAVDARLPVELGAELVDPRRVALALGQRLQRGELVADRLDALRLGLLAAGRSGRCR